MHSTRLRGWLSALARAAPPRPSTKVALEMQPQLWMSRMKWWRRDTQTTRHIAICVSIGTRRSVHRHTTQRTACVLTAGRAAARSLCYPW